MFYLIAQLYAKSNNKEAANEAFEKSIGLTTDPVMAAYAKIYQISLASNNNDRNAKIEEDVKALIKLANREKYISYKPIIYAAAGEMELSRDSVMRAISLLEQSNKYNSTDPELKLKNNLTIAELAFSNKKYTLAKKYFDSTSNTQPGFTKELEIKKSIVTDLANALSIIETEDSLQMVANMNEKQREIYIKEYLKKLKKEEGLKFDLNSTGLDVKKNNLLEDRNNELFQNQGKSGEWYFNNPTLKAQGSISFKNKWGNRPNEDNWRRSNANSGLPKMNVKANEQVSADVTKENKNNFTEISFDNLVDNLPTTPEKLIESNKKKAEAIKTLATLYKDKLGNCKESIYWNNKLLNIQPDSASIGQIYFDLAFCYKQLDSSDQAHHFTDLLIKQSPNGNLTKLLLNPKSSDKPDKIKEATIEKKYTEIYNQFISGEFNKALANKKLADSLYGDSYWTPQLLYIESVYYVKERKDSLAIATLTKIETIAPYSQLASKSKILREVLKNRDSIETNLKAMKVTRMKDDDVESTAERPNIVPKRMVRDDNNLLKKDSTKLIAESEKKIITPSSFQFDPKEAYGVIMIMNGVDIVYINEAKRALTRYHAEKFYQKNLTIRNDKIGETPYILISLFTDTADALSYIEKTKPVAAKEIFPWLPADKYSFYIVSPGNLKKMLEDKETVKYIEFLKSQFPGKF